MVRSCIFRGVGFALCLCNTKAKLAIRLNGILLTIRHNKFRLYKQLRKNIKKMSKSVLSERSVSRGGEINAKR